MKIPTFLGEKKNHNDSVKLQKKKEKENLLCTKHASKFYNNDIFLFMHKPGQEDKKTPNKTNPPTVP